MTSSKHTEAQLHGKVALITGSDSGIGQATAIELAGRRGRCVRRFAQIRLAAGGQGKIINISSVHADNPNAGGSDYDCSKGAIRMLTRTLALELAPHQVNVNSVAPGMVLTPFNQAAIDDSDLLDEQVQSIPWKRAAQPGEIAKVATFLASADADYVTGATYVIDGGLKINLGQGA